MGEVVNIKSMVCPRCISAVETTLRTLNIPFEKVILGQAILKQNLTSVQEKQLGERLQEQGFELLSSTTAKLISELKTIIIEQIHHSNEPLAINFSDFIQEQMGYDYSYLSRLFSSVEGITINRFIVVQKIEKVKELLFYDELTTAQIADRLNYNSVAYLSSIFKKETGMTLTEFKELHEPRRKGIDKV